MFQCVKINQILNPNFSEEDPPYWLAQLRKVDWIELLRFVNVKAEKSLQRQKLIELALPRFEFLVCESRGDVWQRWVEIHQLYRGLVIQFRHSESNWSRGTPEFVNLEKNEPLGVVNIAGRLYCKVK